MLNPEKYLDHRNQDLWNELCENFSIRLEYSKEDNYACFCQGKQASLFVDRDSVCRDSFTHELLHIYLKSKDIYLGNSIRLLVSYDEVLSKILSDNLLEHIGNCLDHIKMLPIYLDKGFRVDKFLSDYTEPKCTENEITLIRQYINAPNSWKQAADLYIGKYFAIKSCPNLSFDYSHYLKQLNGIDSELYEILDKFWNGWINFDIYNQDAIFNNYRDLSTFLTDSLKEWAGKK